MRLVLLIAGALLTAPAGSPAALADPVAAKPGTPAQLFVLIYRPGPAWRQGEPMARQALGPHAAYHKALVAQGRSFAAGPFLSSEGGMALIRARDLEEAKAILAEDPAILSGVFRGSIEAWSPRLHTNAPLPPG